MRNEVTAMRNVYMMPPFCVCVQWIVIVSLYLFTITSVNIGSPFCVDYLACLRDFSVMSIFIDSILPANIASVLCAKHMKLLKLVTVHHV